ncbi:liver stage associated protein 1 [Plasmodium brasilianum]|uniref:Liver stage associated protein 1 n=1 Tax=Plasmodium brasilianum TaxID=5824 RepID=A0ACB9Y355_PLABR|nr:liver stage associated protein 1 [Plasmodium brasilianum]
MMKVSKRLSFFILILSIIVILPYTLVYANIPVELLDYETFKKHDIIKAKGRKDELVLLSLVCVSILSALCTLWGIRLHHLHDINKKKTRRGGIKSMGKSKLSFESEDSG